MASVRIEPLERKHRSLLKEFRNQQASQVEYVQRFALRHVEKDLLPRTFLAIHADEHHERLAGYFTLTTVSIDRARRSSTGRRARTLLVRRVSRPDFAACQNRAHRLPTLRHRPIDEAAARFYERIHSGIETEPKGYGPRPVALGMDSPCRIKRKPSS